ncbi:hypothetical protein LY10_00366 [Planktotalea frisia]|uniref:Uncharacterized protein n=1 Tax=Planktotalea frisia TaxID=696762 RepID=A0A1L9NW09_9RHOB|nr:hypothetical protein [Planktotalea frisia]OJI93466.1 hypothetical protein PFRI_23660 [Planktotalea frisia]PZX35183.1 hypothetical protein LY10_00366 [Planktotalea frisia]
MPHKSIITLASICFASIAAAGTSVPSKAMRGFAEHCFSPYLTAEKATTRLGMTGVRLEFYDLDPFSSAAPSPVTGRAAKVGTDRRCEVAFDGDHAAQAAKTAVDALTSQGIVTPAALPSSFQSTTGTEILAARQLNPKRIAVVHVGTRKGPGGIETFMTVERLLPSELKD